MGHFSDGVYSRLYALTIDLARDLEPPNKGYELNQENYDTYKKTSEILLNQYVSDKEALLDFSHESLYNMALSFKNVREEVKNWVDEHEVVAAKFKYSCFYNQGEHSVEELYKENQSFYTQQGIPAKNCTIFYNKMMFPEGVTDRSPEEMWNSLAELEKTKKRKNRIASVIDLELPRIMTRSDAIAITEEYINEVFKKNSRPVQCFMGENKDGYYIKLVVADRQMKKDGTWYEQKGARKYVDKNGNEIKPVLSPKLTRHTKNRPDGAVGRCEYDEQGNIVMTMGYTPFVQTRDGSVLFWDKEKQFPIAEDLIKNAQKTVLIDGVHYSYLNNYRSTKWAQIQNEYCRKNQIRNENGNVWQVVPGKIREFYHYIIREQGKTAPMNVMVDRYINERNNAIFR